MTNGKAATAPAIGFWYEFASPYSYLAASRIELLAAATIGALVTGLGRDPASVLERATSPPNKARPAAAGEAAMRRGIFGAPSFLVGGELFWGNDRLEQAIAWARNAVVGRAEYRGENIDCSIFVLYL